MSDLRDTIKAIQGEVGVKRDGVFGPVTAGAVLAALRARHADPLSDQRGPVTTTAQFVFDDRTERNLGSLDMKAASRFREFLALANATAATMGCTIKLISGTRTFAEQERLYQAYLNGGPKAAPAGSSWHNYGIAGDCAVFQGGIYCDQDNPKLAEQVYAAIAVHAKACGLEWGGTWRGKSCDPPHFQVEMDSSSPTAAHKKLFKEKGSVL